MVAYAQQVESGSSLEFEASLVYEVNSKLAGLYIEILFLRGCKYEQKEILFHEGCPRTEAGLHP